MRVAAISGSIIILMLAAWLAAPAKPLYAAAPTIATAKPVGPAQPAASGQAAPKVPVANVNTSGQNLAAPPPVGGPVHGGPAAPPHQPPSLWGSFGSSAIMIGLLVVLMFVLFGGRAKEEKKRKAMIAALKKGDRVVTMGGLIASVVDVRDNEVVLKVDESTNVKERYTKSAIASVIGTDNPTR